MVCVVAPNAYKNFIFRKLNAIEGLLKHFKFSGGGGLEVKYKNRINKLSIDEAT